MRNALARVPPRATRLRRPPRGRQKGQKLAGQAWMEKHANLPDLEELERLSQAEGDGGRGSFQEARAQVRPPSLRSFRAQTTHFLNCCCCEQGTP